MALNQVHDSSDSSPKIKISPPKQQAI